MDLQGRLAVPGGLRGGGRSWQRGVGFSGIRDKAGGVEPSGRKKPWWVRPQA